MEDDRVDHSNCNTWENQRRAAWTLFGLAGVTLRRYNNTRDEIIIVTQSDDTNHGSSSYYSSPLNSTIATTALNLTSVISLSRSSKLEPSSGIMGLQLQQETNYPLLTTSQKRQSYLSWDDYFLMVAFLSAQRSKDPNTQVGACIVNPKKRIVGIGYNGFPCGCSDDLLPWSRVGHSPLHTKYPYVCHAEANAICMWIYSRAMSVPNLSSKRESERLFTFAICTMMQIVLKLAVSYSNYPVSPTDNIAHP